MMWRGLVNLGIEDGGELRLEKEAEVVENVPDEWRDTWLNNFVVAKWCAVLTVNLCLRTHCLHGTDMRARASLS
jgi:hypothetical protein